MTADYIAKMLRLYRRFRKLWVLQGDMMHPGDRRDAQERLVRLSDELLAMEAGMKSMKLGVRMTSCGVCSGIIYGESDKSRGVIKDAKTGTVTGKWVEYDPKKLNTSVGSRFWVHYPGPCWMKVVPTVTLPDVQKAAANDKED